MTSGADVQNARLVWAGRKRLGAAAIAAMAIVLAGCGDSSPNRPAPTPAQPFSPVLPLATVTVSVRAPSMPVPRSFFGISTEYWGINHFGRFMGDYKRIMSLLRVPGNGPFVLRIGGDSADHSVLDLNVRLPSDIFDVRRPWFRRVTTLSRTLRARLILDLNLVTDTPAEAGRWAGAAMTGLPRGSLMDYEVGNEPDLFTHRYWVSVYSPVGLLVRDLPLELSPLSYVAIFHSYSRVLSRISPQVGLAAPVVAYPALSLSWISTLLKAPHRGLRLVTAHEYPYSACATRLSPLYPTIDRILSENATAGMAAAVRPAIELAHRAGYPLRLTEINSVTCGGTAGVSDTFATALWAPDALFELMRAGADGANVHVRAYAINGAFGLGQDGIVPHPLVYGLILFTRMLGPDARLARLKLTAHPTLHFKAWAVRVGPHSLRVLLINKGPRGVRAVLHLPATAPGTVRRLVAPSPRATTGERLNGQYLGARERWVGRPGREAIKPTRHLYALTLPPTSAALVEVQTEARAR